MNRKQFLSAIKSLLIVSLVGLNRTSLFGHPFQPTRRRENKPAVLDKDNYLVRAYCIFATPGWGDGKNGDDSHVVSTIDIECYDNLYSGSGLLLDNTEIEVNVVREMEVGFSAKDARAIFYDGVINVGMNILGNKTNQNETTNDKWNVRYEFVMQFKKGNILSTCANDPAVEYHFQLAQTNINSKSFWERKELTDHRCLPVNGPIG